MKEMATIDLSPILPFKPFLPLNFFKSSELQKKGLHKIAQPPFILEEINSELNYLALPNLTLETVLAVMFL